MKLTKLLIGFFALLILFGCSVSTEFFIQNLTTSQQIVKIKYKEKISKYLIQDFYKMQAFEYKNGIVNPKNFNKNNNAQSLEIMLVNDSTLMVELPANSTARIAKSMNYQWKSKLENVEIQNQKYSIKDLEKKSQKVKYDYIYQIK